MDKLPDLKTVATLIQSAAERWYTAVEWIAVLIGICLLAGAARRLIEYGQDRRAGWGNAVAMMVTAIALLYLPSSAATSLQTLYGKADILAYAPKTEDWSSLIIAACLRSVRLVGLIGFVRGWLIASLIGRGAIAHGATSRALCFIVGGAACLNIGVTTQVVLGTLGLDSPFR